MYNLPGCGIQWTKKIQIRPALQTLHCNKSRAVSSVPFCKCLDWPLGHWGPCQVPEWSVFPSGERSGVLIPVFSVLKSALPARCWLGNPSVTSSEVPVSDVTCKHLNEVLKTRLLRRHQELALHNSPKRLSGPAWPHCLTFAKCLTVVQCLTDLCFAAYWLSNLVLAYHCLTTALCLVTSPAYFTTMGGAQC